MALFGRKQPTPEPTALAAAHSEPVERTLAEQLAVTLEGVRPLRPFGMQLNEVAGLTLCEDIISDIDLPMISTALVDGYGVRASDTVGATELQPVELQAVGVADRDSLPADGLASGGCVLVAAGAPTPTGVDAVVPLADATRNRHVVTFAREARVNENRSVRGATLSDGTLLLKADTVLDPLAIGLLAEVGLDKVLVRPRPRVVVLGVGDGLVEPGLPITGIGQGYAAGPALIAACARADGATVYTLDAARPDGAALRQVVSDQLIRADLVVLLAESDTDAALAGGVLAALGDAEPALVRFDGGHEITSGRLGDDRTPAVVLPAAAVSAYVGYRTLVRPLIDRLSDRDRTPSAHPRARAAVALTGGDGVRYVPVMIVDGTAKPARGAAGFAYDLQRADALAVVPAGGVAAGALVECLALGSAVRE